MKEMMPIPKGSLLYISTGEYSDYCVTGVFRALDDIDPNALRDAYLAEHPEESKPYHFSVMKFLAYVAKRGLLEDIPSFEWHLGDYSCADSMFVSLPDAECA